MLLSGADSAVEGMQPSAPPFAADVVSVESALATAAKLAPGGKLAFDRGRRGGGRHQDRVDARKLRLHWVGPLVTRHAGVTQRQADEMRRQRRLVSEERDERVARAW